MSSSEQALSKTMHLRLRVSTLVGIYEYLQERGINTDNLSFSKVLNLFCYGIIEGERKAGRLDAHEGEDWEDVLAELRGEKPESKVSTPSFYLPEDEDQGDMSLDEALSQVVQGPSADEDRELRIDVEPDETEPQREDAQEGPPWEGVEMHEGEVDWHLLGALYSQEKFQKDEAYEKALRVIIAQVPSRLLLSTGTTAFFSSLYKTYREYVVRRDMNERDLEAGVDKAEKA